jgi:NADPH-dependent glutamate synthase beta subunit-like oxidoreductase/Pyruvate/2-oxoacid:ferredoxin oxidoreductase delta subunit
MSATTTPVPPTWTTGSTEAIRTGTWRAALPRHVQAPSPCHQACPVNGDIAEWIGLARERDFRGAWDVLTRHNPFPAIAGRICHHPCETACNRVGYDESLSICKLERFVGDLAIARGWTFEAAAVERRERVAIVGGGPSGLAAAFQLRRMGYRVTLVEARNELGGLMRHGIPSYRLARDVLDAEIARIVAMGVDVRHGEKPATLEAWEALRATHDAVYVATGAQKQKRLPALDYGKPWVVDGAAWLAAANAGSPPALGRRLVVIGGGSAALDAARSARRAGHDVTILALEHRSQMPAQREEVDEALEEGIALVDGAMLVRAHEEGGALRIECTRVRFEPGARRGQFAVAPVEGSEFALSADAIVTSIGQDPDLAALGRAYPRDGALVAVDASQATGVDGTWAGGDVASMARYVTDAIGQGKRAALAIDRALRGRAGEPPGNGSRHTVTPLATARDEIVPLAAIATHYHPKLARAAARRLDAAERLGSGDEVQLGFDVEQALAETTRCFSCGTCIHCDNCVVVCPDLALERADGGYRVLGDYCKGCGLCVKECPTGSMDMVEEAR